jgi:hypothetical protein
MAQDETVEPLIVVLFQRSAALPDDLGAYALFAERERLVPRPERNIRKSNVDF